jgi:hypothetical protein
MAFLNETATNDIPTTSHVFNVISKEDKWVEDPEDDFWNACHYGELDDCKRLCEKFDFSSNIVLLNDCFISACNGNYISICEWMFNYFVGLSENIEKENISSCFFVACVQGRIEACRWLSQKFGLPTDLMTCLYQSFMCQKTEIVEFLLEKANLESEDVEKYKNSLIGEYADEECVNNLKKMCQNFSKATKCF